MFKVKQKDKNTKARAGVLMTPHGKIYTPTFTPVGTQATVKSLSPEDLKACGAQLIFSNTYHLHLRPGEDLIKDFGGLGKFMSWQGPTITDSGGFQVFSLGQVSLSSRTSFGIPAVPVGRSEMLNQVQHDNSNEPRLVKINQDGVKFRSHLDGTEHIFTPEESIKIQKKLGADLILAFDECAPHTATHEYAAEAMERTHAWVQRCITEFQNKETTYFPQALYGIVQGGMFEDLRIASANFIATLPVDGIAIGGVSVGETKKEMRNALEWVTPHLPEEKPRHLLGIGEVDDIFDAVSFGMDTFDCVIPTRFGRYGIVFISPKEGGSIKNRYRLDLTKTIYAKDQGPVTNDCACYVCRTFKRGYLHHLIKANELLGYRLASYHNTYFLLNLTRQIRQSILNEQFESMKKEWLTN